MKWTEERDVELRMLISQGKKYDEIAREFNVTARAIGNRCFRLKLNIIHHKEYECLNCKKQFSDLIKSERRFCSSQCSGSFNTKGRVHSDETKNRIRQSLIGKVMSPASRLKLMGENNPMWIDGRSLVVRPHRVFKEKDAEAKRKCTYCSQFEVLKKHKRICDTCRTSYYEAYRPSCEFKFNIQDFKDEFEFSLIERYGRYSPTNKGNNLGGVSRDHLYSVRDGFVNKVDAELISHPANCRLMKHSDNSSKHSLSMITLEELKERVEKWNQKYGGVVRVDRRRPAKPDTLTRSQPPPRVM